MEQDDGNDAKQAAGDLRRLPAAIVVTTPFAAAAVSLSLLWLVARGHVPPLFPEFTTWVVVADGIFATIASAAGGLFLRDKRRHRFDDLLGGATYAFLIYSLLIGVTWSLIK